MLIDRHNLIPGVLCCLILLLPITSRAQDISVEYATSREDNAIYLVDIGLKLQLDDQITEALQHGVSLDIDIDLEVRQERKWIWDKLITETTLQYQLQHHPLSDAYLVTNLDADTREQFQTLSEALAYLGSVNNYPLIESEKLLEDKNYIGLVRAELNIEELPPPLKPATYVSSQWHLESDWYEWVFR